MRRNFKQTEVGTFVKFSSLENHVNKLEKHFSSFEYYELQNTVTNITNITCVIFEIVMFVICNNVK